MRSILLATTNAHKARELEKMLGGMAQVHTLAEFDGAPAVVEDAPDFRGNATLKAVALANWLAAAGLTGIEWVLADDSGLEVDAINGAPGVHSARFAALDSGRPGNSPDAENNRKLLRLLSGVPEERRTARFRCAIALTPVPDQLPRAASAACDAQEAELGTEIFEGTCEGRILEAARGAQGFGYDPLFVPEGQTKTFAELTTEEKGELSHRARAMEKLKAHLAQRANATGAKQRR